VTTLQRQIEIKMPQQVQVHVQVQVQVQVQIHRSSGLFSGLGSLRRTNKVQRCTQANREANQESGRMTRWCQCHSIIGVLQLIRGSGS